MSEFSDRPFVAGSLVGLRTFRVDQLGRLTGVTHQDVWTPGENVAVCHRRNDVPMSISGYALGGQITFTTSQIAFGDPAFTPRGKKGKKKWIPPTPTPAEKAAALKHDVAAVACQCGFYAYFDGANDYLTEARTFTSFTIYGPGEPDRAVRLAAIVEGYGVCTVGTRGFRASKARVLAVIDPQGDRAQAAIAFDKVRRNYPEVEIFSTEREAVAAFPLTDPLGAAPTDDDFWTRSAR